jgi:excisionase family DNA binding protein
MGIPRSFDDYPPVMDTADVAEMLLIPDVQTVQRMARQGRIPAHREPGTRRWRLDRNELIAWLKSEARATPVVE